MALSCQRREMLLSWTTNMAAVKSTANQQYYMYLQETHYN